MMSATWNSYRFVVAPIFTQSAFRVVGVSCHQSLEVGLVRQLSWPCSQTTGADIDRCPTVGDHPSSVVHITTTLAHGDVVERVRNGEHKLATLIGFLCLSFVDYFLSMNRICRPAITRKVFFFPHVQQVLSVACLSGFPSLRLLFAFAFCLCFCLGLPVTRDVRPCSRIWRRCLDFISEVTIFNRVYLSANWKNSRKSSMVLRNGQLTIGHLIWQKEEDQRKGFNIALNPNSSEHFLFFRAIQGHSLILHCKTMYCCRRTSPSTSTTSGI